MHRGVVLHRKPELLGGGEDRDREIVVDVRGHAGQRELNRLTPLRASFDERPPGDRTTPPGADRRFGVEVQAGEDDVQPVDEIAVLELGPGARRVDRASDLEVEAVEDRDAVLAR